MPDVSETPDDIVGHKTFHDKDCGYCHEPLTGAEVVAILDASDAHLKERAERLPDEQSAIEAMFDAYDRLRELGWGEVMYCPKDGSTFQVIEPGSPGIHTAYYHGEWPKGSWWIMADGDLWPSRPILFKLFPEDEAKRKAKMVEAAQRCEMELEALKIAATPAPAGKEGE